MEQWKWALVYIFKQSRILKPIINILCYEWCIFGETGIEVAKGGGDGGEGD